MNRGSPLNQLYPKETFLTWAHIFYTRRQKYIMYPRSREYSLNWKWLSPYNLLFTQNKHYYVTKHILKYSECVLYYLRISNEHCTTNEHKHKLHKSQLFAPFHSQFAFIYWSVNKISYSQNVFKNDTHSYKMCSRTSCLTLFFCLLPSSRWIVGKMEMNGMLSLPLQNVHSLLL